MKRFGSIYKITHKTTGKAYIGQTIRAVSRRFRDHCVGNRSSIALSLSIKKYGEEAFSFEELFTSFDVLSLNEMETYFIALYNTFAPNGYNLTMGGHNRGIIAESTREKMKQAKLGKSVIRTKSWGEDSRLRKSIAQGGRAIVAENITTGEKRHYAFIQQAEKDGFQNGSVYKVLGGKRAHCKGFRFYYADQSGSIENKNSLHAQSIGFDPAKAD